ncbi:hypothetical protein [Jiella sp. R10]|uniref:Uncharacterized protein n=1 Tax=Antarcticirhabdus aurantiaca TaxID=2606717 RepID=A0ACD4NQJ9_9HYPH|nr:hypothetical protein OXU80_01330 [Jeongeuplla avenae]
MTRDISPCSNALACFYPKTALARMKALTIKRWSALKIAFFILCAEEF